MKNKFYDVLHNPFDGFSAVATLQKQTRTIPADRNYQIFFLEMINCNPSQIVGIFQRINGQLVKQWVSGTDVDLQNIREGLPPANALVGGGGNYVLALSERRDRLFGGALSYLTAPSAGSPFPVGMVVGDTKDLETNCSLNAGSPDPVTKFSINTITLEIWLQDAGSFGGNKPLINLTSYCADPFPGGPGLMKFVDSKQVNIPSGQFTLDKDSAFTLGDGQRLNMDQVLLMNPTNVAFDNFLIYWQTVIIRNRNININEFMVLFNTLKQNVSGLTPLFDSRELLYADETQPIGALNSAFKIQGVNPGALISLQLYQISTGMLVPTNPGVIQPSAVA